ncbi:Transcriptional regulatory protein LiaR [Arthrobacter saudimassiliensis]|uniref:Transcriptional regulatory protein LiaR n=1 Tax=Arthrobacter saudimassiliensis TaxID=1461584 RepID=A0A078MPM9_9MICC|nr:Transcriptional regulatory protein LiaR [Arthrobacter saudimassiliensis]
MTVRILLADDHAAVRGGLRMILGAADGLEVVGEAADGATAVSMARALRPDLVLMDVQMPGMDGIEATEAIIGAGHAAVLVLTTFEIDDYVFRALRAGAAGFLLKTAEPAELVRAVHRVADGDSVLSPEVTGTLIAAALGGGPAAAAGAAGGTGGTEGARRGSGAGPAAPVDTLTAREQAVLDCLADGLSNQDISARLGIAETTVKTHVSRVLAKLGVASRVQAALLYRGA